MTDAEIISFIRPSTLGVISEGNVAEQRRPKNSAASAVRLSPGCGGRGRAVVQREELYNATLFLDGR